MKGRRIKVNVYQAVFWIALTGFLAVCAFFQIHNAHWLIGDEAIVIHHTGMGRAFSPLGFEGMASIYGRLYPFAYNLYNVLLLFSDGRVSPTAVYTLQAISLTVFAVAFAQLALHLLKEMHDLWKYATAFFFVVICVFRVYQEFITCYTGVWIVYLFLPIFLLFSCRFMDFGNWGDGIVAILGINYIIYCYETVFTIPMTVGMCGLLFQFRKLTRNQRLFHALLVASGLLFLLIYVVFVLPKAQGFYHHYGETTLIGNACKMLLANKLYWLSTIVLAVRAFEILVKKKSYTFFDSLLLSSFAYYVGAVVLKLNFTYYYNIGALVGFTASLYFLKDWIKPQWMCLLVFALALFYGRKIPGIIHNSQVARTTVSQAMDALAEKLEAGENLYWYEPPYEGESLSYLDLRGTSKIRVEVYLSWILQRDVTIEGRSHYSGEKGIWMVYPGYGPNLPVTPDDLLECDCVFSTSGIIGYQNR